MAKNPDNQVSAVRKTKHGTALTIFFTLLSIVYVMPIIIVVMNSFKRKSLCKPLSFQNWYGQDVCRT